MKFEVNYEKVFHLIVEIEAEDKEEARDKADKYLDTKTKDELLNRCQEGYFEHTCTDEVEE